jgi:hypothetical protein
MIHDAAPGTRPDGGVAAALRALPSGCWASRQTPRWTLLTLSCSFSMLRAEAHPLIQASVDRDVVFALQPGGGPSCQLCSSATAAEIGLLLNE